MNMSVLWIEIIVKFVEVQVSCDKNDYSTGLGVLATLRKKWNQMLEYGW